MLVGETQVLVSSVQSSIFVATVPQLVKWRFRFCGATPSHLFVDGIFHEINRRAMGYPHWKHQNVSFGEISPVSIAAPSQSTSWERPALEPHCHDDHKMIIRTIRTIYKD